MRVLVVGSGGREHALAWKLAQSRDVHQVFVAPGNGGTQFVAINHPFVTVNHPIEPTDTEALLALALQEQIDLTIVGPEAPLCAGLVDAFEAAGLCAFGPSSAAARLEGSKAFTKRFMIEEGIPTAPGAVFSDAAAAKAFLRELDAPFAIKASGLAAGKGVLLAATVAEAETAIERIMVHREFGSAGDQVVIEQQLVGEEVSLMALCDGQTVVPLLPARDYKRAYDGDRGPNTGGMGGFSPSPYLSPEMVDELVQRVLQPVVDGMRRRGTPYKGVLYAGLMLTDHGPRVLEFNCRFGDPEAQLILPLLDSDLLDVLYACVQGRLNQVDVLWKPGYSVGVVLASKGYPGAYAKGKVIQGLDAAATVADAVFHAGTRGGEFPGDFYTSGGRVLTVVAVDETLDRARARAYAAVAKIQFEGQEFRTDIAANVDTSGGGWTATPRGGPASTYAAAGVDISAANRVVDLMREAVRSTYTAGVLGGIGSFGGSFDLEELTQDRHVVLVATTDGVGTKTMIASQMGRYDTVGHDIVNHCVNDILVQGARPLFFLDYVAAAKLDPEEVATLVTGCARACQAVGCALIGGETAQMPGVYRPGVFDLAGTMVGWVERDALLDGHEIVPGDVCIGLRSSGLHTNGYSLVRRIFRRTPWDTFFPELGQSIGEALLTPHRAYLGQLEDLWDEGVHVKGMAHITGASFADNVPRALPDGVGCRLVRSSWEVPTIFRVMQARGGIDEDEMYRIFNMGIGMVLFLAREDAQRALDILGPLGVIIGDTFAWDGTGEQVRL